MLESSSVLSRLHTTRGRSADTSVNGMKFSAGLRIVYHFSPELTLASGASTTPAGLPRWGPRSALGSVRAQASLNQTDPTPLITHHLSLLTTPCILSSPIMSIKSDKWIRRMATEFKMIEPFEPEQVKEIDGRRIVSYGTSSYGYDIRCADEFKLFTNINSTIVDPKEFDAKNFVDVKGESVLIPPNSFALARTVEYFRIPRNVLTICLGKSTYARCGILVNVTPFEPEWEGYVTLEFSNTTPLPAKIYANEGVAQVVFFESDEICETSYKDRGGKYQGQRGVTLPKL